ncbi:23S rRNA (adenine(1618)-N(6))-methyltransferase RlmF [Alishewanella sp. 16-MA]|uniref:Ribosomal RNA large subunit methyltransferase F n=1 Tax=Alishewanella maricola TaxID=2795740 RepID=A0ABS8C2S7_9ALTE|nr:MULTISPECIES: 23S rRNA (adenine(1618)-N(6))-methyltransferase RlmF [Alishewanella]MCB5226597.1 23S rRNA (adenine(1618)-N(6))-methyltransferase RlmF [Alishewanella maricola]MDP4944097.1 23S rRNA (adenine(1618)-N(6))-methyltransferase RlmF [Alishewanella sp.]MDP5034561.1 23S rRNA (adenine(1618)-N(6))-methyltransferase RlmF [Alishewanella sp.]MDP5459248.1 23S rRNA (adenine(1618)-N(6))-methyltransferase RlmF [Alishewanella sp. SMS8]
MTSEPSKLHPRNPHHGRYDLPTLCAKYPALTPFLTRTPTGAATIDFSNSQAVQHLNAAILASYYQIDFWQLPSGYLCPPIPGRADYLHYAADLLGQLPQHQGQVPQGKQVRMLDIGCGANCIYPILATRSFGWQVVGSDIDQQALNIANTIINANDRLKGMISLRLQAKPLQIFQSIIHAQEYFDLVVCNPPFYRSAAEAQAVNQQKWQKLGKAKQGRNFSGNNNELWCDGGELAFISNMIKESALFAKQVGWFTTLVSQQKHHNLLLALLTQYQTVEVKQLKMQQGQKSSLLLTWRFH